MVNRWIRILLVALAVGGRVWAAEIIPEIEVDDVLYENVRWGPVNQGKVVMFHSRGVTTVAVDKLPEEYARRFGYRPTKPTDNAAEQPAAPLPVPAPVRPVTARPPAEERIPPQERPAFEAARNAKMVLNSKLVDRSELTVLTGFTRPKARVDGEERASEGLMLELAQKKHTDRPVPANMEMRPGLWDGTGEEVFLRDYTTNLEQGSLVRLYAKEGEAIKSYRTFFVAQELTYELWKKLR